MKIKIKIKTLHHTWHKLIFGFILGCAFGFSSIAVAKKDIRYGFGLGFGGAGVKDTVNLNGVPTVIQKSEGPGVGTVFVDNLISDSSSLGLEYSFGFRLGPFSAGVSFFGLTWRNYIFGPALFHIDDSDEKTTLYSKQNAWYYGLNTGVATAAITRTNDQVQSLSATGFYLGPKIGIDHPVSIQLSYRFEFEYLSTFFATAPKAPSLSKFALQFGIFYFY